ncbi:hypothetical protein C8A01DRAFT_50195 [Parachaetomium inaequale]|uniref:Rhodopsin domain-containing protein n=1 Tax=Parachaetomium inaequale TaxID=2588326 RepID=A0AAN6PBX6_9PEZI|nr:hypothetical protein C8A01DRAFT_50195 [Parachaetomium inaequale]
MVVLAYACFWGAVNSTLAMIDTPGYFVHQWDLRLRDLIPTSYHILVFGVCYSFVLPLLKVAIMIEWCRMFVPHGSVTKTAFWWGCVIVSFVQIGAAVATIIALNLQCIPHQAIWDFTIPNARCFKLYNLQVSSASIQLASDICMILLPQRVIWTLKMSWQKRMGVSVIFGLGVLACVSAAFRLATTVAFGEAQDAMFALGPLVFWATAEMTCGFFIICVPCMPKILQQTGVLRKIKQALGMSTGPSAGTPGKPGYYANGGSGSRGPRGPGSKLSGTGPDSYYKLGEDGVPMGTLTSSESTEHLRDDNRDHAGKLGAAAHNAAITRTTHIAVTEDSRSASDGGSNIDMQLYKQKVPWHGASSK